MRPTLLAHPRRRLLVLGVVPALTLVAAAGARADRGQYVARSFSEPASAGLAVQKPLDEFVAVSSARVIVPVEWKRLPAKAGQLRFITPGQSCRYNVTFTVRNRPAPARSAADYVADGLPSPGPRYVLDSGERRGSSAFRVIREKNSGPVVGIRALWAAVVTRRADVAPAGQVVWTEVGATAVSRQGDECHSGTWRERLGPQLGDALATARTKLRFVRKPR